MKTPAQIVVCPRCQSKRDTDERFCWFCGLDFEKHDGICTACKQPKPRTDERREARSVT